MLAEVCAYSLWCLPIALVYRSTAGWYLPVLKTTFPSLVFSAIANVHVSRGSDAGLGVVVGGDVDVDGRGVSGSTFEFDPGAWLTQKSVLIVFFFA